MPELRVCALYPDLMNIYADRGNLQLLADRGAFFACARRALVPGGRLAAAIATDLETVDDPALLPLPDEHVGAEVVVFRG